MIQLGAIVKDTITGLKGTAVARCIWLHGCIRVTMQPHGLHDGKPLDLITFDEPQLVEVTEAPPVPAPSATGGPRTGPTRNHQ